MNYWVYASVTTEHYSEKNIEKDLLKRICNVFKIEEHEIKSKSRLRCVALPRQVFMYVLRNQYGYTLHKIKNIVNRNHVTVLHSCRTISNQMEYNADLRNKVNNLINTGTIKINKL